MAGVVAKSYSEALFSLASEEGKLDVYKDQLCLIQEQLKENPDFMRVLTHPKIHKDEKKKMLESVFSQAVDHTVLNFLKLLVDKGRFINLADITKEFVKQYNEVNNILVAIVTSAKELSEDETKRIQEMLEKKTQKKVDMRMCINTDLIAGIRIKIGDQVLDNTAKARMERLKVLAQTSDTNESRGECR